MKSREEMMDDVTKAYMEGYGVEKINIEVMLDIRDELNFIGYITMFLGVLALIILLI